MAGVASHIECGVTASSFGALRADVMAGEAKVFVLRRSRSRLQQLIRIVRLVWIVALYAITHRRRMQGLPGLRLLFLVTAEAQGLCGGGRQFDSRDVVAHPDFVAAQACRGN